MVFPWETRPLWLRTAPRAILYEEYFPYGGTAYRSGENGVDVSAKRYRYCGAERDEETGFYMMGMRYYCPWLGRWTTADPLGLQAGINLYLYCRAGPVVYSDPSGLDVTSPVKAPEKEQVYEDPSTATKGAPKSPTVGGVPLDPKGWLGKLVEQAGEAKRLGAAQKQRDAEQKAEQDQSDIQAYEGYAETQARLTPGPSSPFGDVRPSEASDSVLRGFDLTHTGHAPSVLEVAENISQYLYSEGELGTLIGGGKKPPVGGGGGGATGGGGTGGGGASNETVRLYHGTSSNRASKIVGNERYPTQGFRPGPDKSVYFSRDFATAEYFGRESAARTGARSATVIEFTIPTTLAERLGLTESKILGEARGAPPIDIPGASGREHILSGADIINEFNEALKAGIVTTRRRRIP